MGGACGSGLSPREKRGIGRAAGFSLPELLIASAVFLMLVGGVVTCHLFGLRMLQTVEPKMVASAAMQRLANRMVGELQSAGRVQVGRWENGAFVPVVPGDPETGDSLALYGGGWTNLTAVYVRDGASGELLRRDAEGHSEVLAAGVTNTPVFSTRTAAGVVLTNVQAVFVVGIDLGFSVMPGTGQALTDYYRGCGMQLRVRPRPQ
jgi:prepilin-type N-terminal cleavage/methylation domain-containing protein